MTDDEDDWLTPTEALDFLEPRHGANAKAFIADKLRDGEIVARAALVWDSFEPSIQTAWKNREESLLDPAADVERDGVVNRLVWRSSRHWAADQELWRWPENRFFVTRRRQPPHRTIIQGLRFRRADIVEFTKPPSKRSGRKPKFTGYARLFSVLLKLERAQHLTLENFPTKAALENRVLDEIYQAGVPKDDRLDDDTVRRCVSAIWDEVLDPENPRAMAPTTFRE